MSLAEHKELLQKYERVLFELEQLSSTKAKHTADWQLTCTGVWIALQVPDEVVAKLLQERIWALEADARDRALALGIGA